MRINPSPAISRCNSKAEWGLTNDGCTQALDSQLRPCLPFWQPVTIVFITRVCLALLGKAGPWWWWSDIGNAGDGFASGLECSAAVGLSVPSAGTYSVMVELCMNIGSKPRCVFGPSDVAFVAISKQHAPKQGKPRK